MLWQKLDRLLEGSTESPGKVIYAKLDDVEKHLALVFHRFLSGEFPKRKLSIEINGHPVTAFDPFFISHSATQLLPEERVRIRGYEIRIQAYILPHHSKLSKKDQDYYLSRSDFLSNQGAYVYRNGRLMVWGGWFRQIPKSEATKLARVRIDFPNALDEEWTIDIKKSRAHPPGPIREKMRQIISKIAEQSTRVYIGRGNRLFDAQEHPLWERFQDRPGVRYVINRSHPLLAALRQESDPKRQQALESILRLIERAIPVEAIHADYASLPQRFDEKEEIAGEDLKELLVELYTLLSTSGKLNKETFTRMVIGLKPFSEYQNDTLKLIEELFL